MESLEPVPGTGASAVRDGAPQPARRGSRAPWTATRAALRSVGRELVPLASLHGLRGAAVEAAWVSAHLAIYPLGLLGERPAAVSRYHLEGLDPVQRGLVVGDVEAAGTPILLVHGMADNRAIFTVLRRRLRRRGFDRVRTVNYSPVTNDIRQAARRLAEEVEALVAESGHERVHVVGHSLGGLIARYYVQCLGGDERVHTLVTLGSPHAGSLHAHLLPVRVCRQLRRGSDLYEELEAPAPGCRTRFVAFWSDLDQLILPRDSARLDHPDLGARNVLVRGVGHMSIPVDRRVVHEISIMLSQLDAEGGTVTAGVTSLLDETAPGRAPRQPQDQSFSTGA